MTDDKRPTVLTDDMIASLEYFWSEKGNIERWVDYEECAHLFPELVHAVEEFKRARRRVGMEIADLQGQAAAGDVE